MSARDATLPRCPETGEDAVGADPGVCCGCARGSGTRWHMSCIVPKAIAAWLESTSALVTQPLALVRQSLDVSAGSQPCSPKQLKWKSSFSAHPHVPGEGSAGFCTDCGHPSWVAMARCRHRDTPRQWVPAQGAAMGTAPPGPVKR